MLLYALAAILLLAALYLTIAPFVTPYLRFRGTRLVICPETRKTVAVDVDAGHAAWTTVFSLPELRLTSCTRWPERRNCGQACVAQIEAAPHDCLLRNIVARWYQGKACALCGKQFGELNWTQHAPALYTPEQETVQWNELRVEELLRALETHRPVCWNCHVARTFRHQYPELVVDRGWLPPVQEIPPGQTAPESHKEVA